MTLKRLLWRRVPGFVLEHRMILGTRIRGHAVRAPHMELHADGLLCLHVGFEWDGPSGPTLKTASTMRASAIHDALYGLIRAGLLPRSCRADADAELRRWLIRDNAGHLRAWMYWAAVRLFGGFYL